MAPLASRANKIPTNAICSMSLKNSSKHSAWFQLSFHRHCHRIRMQMPSEEITFTAWPKIKSQSQIFRYGHSIFCLPYRPKISDFFNLRLHWVSIVRRHFHCTVAFPLCFDSNDQHSWNVSEMLWFPFPLHVQRTTEPELLLRSLRL